MIARTLVVIVFFTSGFTVAHILVSEGPQESYRESDFVAGNEVSTDSTAAYSEEYSNAQTGPLNWYEKDYRSNWNSLIKLLIKHAGNRNEEVLEFLNRIKEWPAEDQAALLQAAIVSDLPRNDVFDELIHYFLSTLTQNDFEMGFAAFTNMSSEDRNKQNGAFVYTWSKTDPQGVWDWLNAQEKSGTNAFIPVDQIGPLRSGILIRMMTDPDFHSKALELSRSLSDIRQKTHFVNAAIGAIVDHNPNHALSILKDAPELDTVAMDEIIRNWTEEDVFSTASFLKNNSDFVTRTRITEISKNLLLQEGIDEFIELYDSLESARIKSTMAHQAAVRFANRDLDASINWIKTIEDPTSKQQALGAAIRELGYIDNMEDHLYLIQRAFQDDSKWRLAFYQQDLSIWHKAYPEKVETAVNSIPDIEPQDRDRLAEQFNRN